MSHRDTKYLILSRWRNGGSDHNPPHSIAQRVPLKCCIWHAFELVQPDELVKIFMGANHRPPSNASMPYRVMIPSRAEARWPGGQSRGPHDY